MKTYNADKTLVLLPMQQCAEEEDGQHPQKHPHPPLLPSRTQRRVQGHAEGLARHLRDPR
jgi:hypothetical protein